MRKFLAILALLATGLAGWSAEIVVEPNPAPSAGVDISGEGFRPGQRIRLQVDGRKGSVNVLGVRSDGTFAVGPLTDSLTPGPHKIDARDYDTGRILATTTLSVEPADGWDDQPAFGEREPSRPLEFRDQANVVIAGRHFARQIGRDVVSIRLERCANVRIEGCDFDECTEPIFAIGCRNIEVAWCRARNIVGPSERDGTHRGNFVQLDSCTGFWLHDFLVRGGDTEDVVSCYKSGGVSAEQPSVIERFKIEGVDWRSRSGTGVILGDGGTGSYVTVRDGTMLSPGQVGMQICGGIGHKISGLTLFAEPREGTSPNVAISTWVDHGGPRPHATVSDLRVNWRGNDGRSNPFWWQAGSNERITTERCDWNAPVNPEALRAEF